MSADPCADANVPIACTLDAGRLPERVAEWQAFTRRSVLQVERDAHGARLLLANGDDVLVAAASLAQREKECCAFFDFALLLEPEARWLRVTVPAQADAVLASFLEMLAPGA
jgi:hypothetical protein